VQDIVRPKASRDNNWQAPARKLVEHEQHAEHPTMLAAIRVKVIGPCVIGPLGPQIYGPSLSQRPPPLGLLLYHFGPSRHQIR